MSDKFAQGDQFTERDQEMYVVSSAAGGEQFAAVIICDAAYICEKTIFDFRPDHIDTVLGREDYVYV